MDNDNDEDELELEDDYGTHLIGYKLLVFQTLNCQDIFDKSICVHVQGWIIMLQTMVLVAVTMAKLCFRPPVFWFYTSCMTPYYIHNK